jgi:hypothetical protein
MSISLSNVRLPQNPIKKIGTLAGLAAATVFTHLPAQAEQVANHVRQQGVELPATVVCTETTARGTQFQYQQAIHTPQAFNTFRQWCAGEIAGPDHKFVENGVLSVLGQERPTVTPPRTIPTPPAQNTTLNVYAAQCTYSKPWIGEHGNPSGTERVFTYTGQPFTKQTPNREAIAIVESVKNFCTDLNGNFTVIGISGNQQTNTTTYIDRRINNHR